MPSKASRAASRQAKLSRRKRRDRPGPQQTDSGPVRSASLVETGADTGVDTAVAEPITEVGPRREELVDADVSTRPAPRTSARQRSTPRPGRRVAEAGESQVYKHLGSELRLTGIITVLMAAILAGLTFLLG